MFLISIPTSYCNLHLAPLWHKTKCPETDDARRVISRGRGSFQQRDRRYLDLIKGIFRVNQTPACVKNWSHYPWPSGTHNCMNENVNRAAMTQSKLHGYTSAWIYSIGQVLCSLHVCLCLYVCARALWISMWAMTQSSLLSKLHGTTSHNLCKQAVAFNAKAAHDTGNYQCKHMQKDWSAF